MASKDNLGDRIKDYEKAETSAKFMRQLPIIIRLDGRNFSKYTKNFKRPFDDDMSDSMLETTKFLVKESNALIGYTQSDEITLLLYTDNPKSDILFNGKKFKLLSNLASMASVKFYSEITKAKGNISLVKLPSFDCRAFQVPNKIEAWNAILWRVQDSIRNSVQSLGQANFSHKELHRKNQNDIISMLEKNKAIVWGDLPNKYKEGRFVRKITLNRQLTNEEKLKYNIDDVTILVERTELIELELNQKFSTISNREEFLFENGDPI